MVALMFKSSLLLIGIFFVTSCAGLGPKYSAPKSYTAKARAVLVEFYPLLRECYINELDRTKRKIRGSVTFKININRSGKVELVKLIDDSLRNLKIKGCFVKILHQISFPPHDNLSPMQLNQPFKFNPPRKR